MIRGIKNVSGVSCHISCALQILVHSLVPLCKALKKNSPNETGPHPSRILSQLSELVQALLIIDQESAPVDPSVLYKSLANFSSSSSKSTLSLDPQDVGDATTAISILLKVVSQQSSDWAELIDLCTVGWMRHSITGVSKRQDGKTVCRIKRGKPKNMPCPFPLVGQYSSLQRALELAKEAQTITGYNWEAAKPDNYEESLLEESQTGQHYELSEVEWTTTKSLLFETLPRYCFFHLERFSYDKNGDKTLMNASVEIPLTLDPSTLWLDGQRNTTLHLLGGILHVSEGGNIEEEGHYVTILRNSSYWVLVDDESYTIVETELAVLDLLKGTTDDAGSYVCATLVVYGSNEEVEDANLASLVKRIQNQGPEDLIGQRLRVKWAKNKFYTGVVESYDPFTGKHRVLYADGDKKEYVLSQKTIEWI